MGVNREFTSKQQLVQKLLRNDFDTVGKWDMPIIRKCEVDITSIVLIASDHIRVNANLSDIGKTVHFFVEDTKLERYYNNPENYLERLAQYSHLLTPDFSLYTDMPLSLQVFSTFKSRWCGAFWQYYGFSIIPTVSWSTTKSYEFCFDGIEPKSVVAVSTLGGLKNKKSFLGGYYEMKKRINPKQVLCFGKAFSEMGDEVTCVSYLETTRRAK